MQKNVASQKLIVFAFDSTTNLPKTGDAANLTAYVSKDYGSATVLGDTSATEIDATNAKGYYLFDLTQSETNADTLLFTCKSATANIVVLGAPAVVFTTPASFSSINVTNLNTLSGHDPGATLGTGTSTLTQADIRTAVGLASANLDTQLTAIDDYIDTEVAAIKAKTDNLPSDPADASDIAASFSTVNSTLATIAGYVDTEVAAIKAKTDLIPSGGFPTNFPDLAITASTGRVTVGTNNDKTGYSISGTKTTLDALNDITAASVATTLWTDLLSSSDFSTVASIGKLLKDNIDATISSRLASSSYTSPLDAAGVRSAIGLGSANLDTQLTAIDDYIDTEVSAIKAKTDNLPSDPADASDIAASFTTVNTTLATISGYIDTEVAAIKAKTDNLPSSPAATGDPMTLQAGAISDSSFTVPSEASGRPTGMLSMMRRVFEWAANKRTRNRTTGDVLLRNAGDTGTLETQTQSTSGVTDTQTKGV